MLKEHKQASESVQFISNALQSSTTDGMAPWLATFVASSLLILNDSKSQVNEVVTMLEPIIHEERSQKAIDEKLRLLHLGHICSDQQKFVDALNHWEEALEIEWDMLSATEMIYNGIIYLQMAAVYLRMNNKTQSLKAMEKAKTSLEYYYPSTHQMIAGMNLMYGYYLMLNEKTAEAIDLLTKSLENSHFSTNKAFLWVVLTLLAVASLQNGDISRAESFCDQARAYPVPATIPLSAFDL
ncbi:unnamed protein product [Rotaria sordida]|uniref:Uncharacterized protein n=1 Tax=Rotaria sordida TaxID=392033 RepID=A0A815YWF7_9BILA|nr:unnamed protein product [Rotaria sordida]CAF1575816.1 unnamed protein product [Rotaria sordida]